MTSPAELQAIRERDERWLPHRPQNTVADYDRRTLLALYDAQSDEVRRLRSELQRIDTAFENTNYADCDSEEYFEKIRDIARAALGSQP